MTQEEYEAKVQSMPKSLQKMFRESLEITLSKSIVNRFMNVVLQAYAWGQRDAQTDSHDGDYMRGAEDMRGALEIVSNMSAEEIYKYFNQDYSNHLDGLYMVIRRNPGDILEVVDKYQSDQKMEKNEREKASVKAMADVIGIEKLCQIADEIMKQKAAGGECLPF